MDRVENTESADGSQFPWQHEAFPTHSIFSPRFVPSPPPHSLTSFTLDFLFRILFRPSLYNHVTAFHFHSHPSPPFFCPPPFSLLFHFLCFASLPASLLRPPFSPRGVLSIFGVCISHLLPAHTAERCVHLPAGCGGAFTYLRSSWSCKRKTDTCNRRKNRVSL